jgi:hypothetical protein
MELNILHDEQLLLLLNHLKGRTDQITVRAGKFSQKQRFLLIDASRISLMDYVGPNWLVESNPNIRKGTRILIKEEDE